ncbi:cation-dependent mannose-6-phosphate receptor [Spea bombifrons]|uniref:cation-dependent mannose-6-phosphate receptor n=1 Tax=Spea bombifrons TaxID=233779 RepID=UPI00234AFFD1|nr:cation-dependent mannose-6-phosphate receptor [Spea bombifrons]
MASVVWYVCLAGLLVAVSGQIVDDCVLVGGEKKSDVDVAILAKLAPLKNKRFEAKVEEGSDTYVYTFVVCGRVITNNTSTNEGLLQTKVNSKDSSVIGRINETHVISGSDWILLSYRGGDKYDSHCGSEPRTAMIMISCTKNTLADGFMVIKEERSKSTECFYLFEMDSSVACPPEESHLSAGSILLIVFAVLVALYLIGGFVYQRFVVGAKGMEQFPNITFWQEFGNLVADGCDFVCRSRPRSADTAYRGVGDDQLAEEPEERDDHLLPM